MVQKFKESEGADLHVHPGHGVFKLDVSNCHRGSVARLSIRLGKKQTHPHKFVGGIAPVGHAVASSNQHSKSLAGEETEAEELNVG
jgi:hypothetical protein